jgi:hypothetical protein
MKHSYQPKRNSAKKNLSSEIYVLISTRGTENVKHGSFITTVERI